MNEVCRGCKHPLKDCRCDDDGDDWWLAWLCGCNSDVNDFDLWD